MKRYWGACVIVACAVLSGCATSKDVQMTSKAIPASLRTAALLPSDGNSPEMDENLKAAFAQQGVTVTPVAAAASAGTPAAAPDLTVKYTDYWHWDLVMYLRKLEISLWDSKAETMLVQGRWENSPLHGFPNAGAVTKELVDEIFLRLKTTSRPVAGATGN